VLPLASAVAFAARPLMLIDHVPEAFNLITLATLVGVDQTTFPPSAKALIPRKKGKESDYSVESSSAIPPKARNN
jgi:hypothetical protein